MQLIARLAPAAARSSEAGSVTSPRASSIPAPSSSAAALLVADQGDDLVAALGQQPGDGVAELAGRTG